MKVIVGVEDRVYGNAIIDFIAKQKWAAGTSFELLHVIADETTGEVIGDICCDICSQRVESEKQAVKDLLLELELKLIKAVPDAVTEVKFVYGRAKDEILNEVEATKAELLIVGSHGNTGFTRFLLGSVSMALLSVAPCSVLIVKRAHEAKSQSEKAKAGSAAAQK